MGRESWNGNRKKQVIRSGRQNREGAPTGETEGNPYRMKRENERQIIPRLFDKVLRNYIYLELYTIHDEHTHIYDTHAIHTCIYTLKELKSFGLTVLPTRTIN